MLHASSVSGRPIHNSQFTSFESSPFSFTLKSLRSSPRFRARSRVSGRSRARLISFFVSFPNSFFASRVKVVRSAKERLAAGFDLASFRIYSDE